jgi:cellulose synthase (UDP-forming)
MTPLITPASFLHGRVSKPLLVLHAIIAIAYMFILAFWFPRGNTWLYGIIVASQLYYLWQSLSFTFSIWNLNEKAPAAKSIAYYPVDIYITVAGEPTEVVEETVLAAKAIDYPDFAIHILNDGYVAKKDNWREIELLAQRLGVNCITRKTPGGAKAGNINNAMRKTHNPFVAIFDADHIPKPNFLKATMGHFVDAKVAYVQTPQFYKNSDVNDVAGGAWEQQELFFGPLCQGKNADRIVSMCGTNMIIRREALETVGGIDETNIAEDFLTGLRLHSQGYTSVYVPKVLAEGLAPEDLLSYSKQQFRWARGSLEVVFKHNPLFMRGLSIKKALHYLSLASYFLSGIFILLNALVPVAFFYTGQVAFQISTMTLAAVFIPYIVLTIYILRLASNYTLTFRAVSFSMSLFAIHIQAILATLFNVKSGFAITSKKKLSGNFLYLAIPHMLYIAAVFIGVGIAVFREGLTASVMTNMAWAAFNVAIFMPFIMAAAPEIWPVRFLRKLSQTT